ncbi:TOBE domain-containing protein [Hydrogenimonas urashimensis]|uniref:TOBE domain-containing protein n=1 Tax=Hydrogenimonas urashimensis TaxID=2740515 RepID=UPI00191558DF|nr:TOBE domain-containing protein [Hydrogenimonas urashimensis]
MRNAVEGRLWLGKERRAFLGHGRMELLKKIDETGSISKAAKAMKMSYKAAWDAVDTMNNLAEKPLVERVTGGKGGGGTRLTAYGREVVETFRVLEEEHERFLRNLSQRINAKDGHLRLLKSMSMRISARNQLAGEVIRIKRGAVNAEVTLRLKGGHPLTATITNESLDELDISTGSRVYALFKANALILSTETNVKLGVENRFEGVVERIEKGSVNHEVVLELEGGTRLCAQLGTSALRMLGLKAGMKVNAFCKANHIMIGIY